MGFRHDMPALPIVLRMRYWMAENKRFDEFDQKGLETLARIYADLLRGWSSTGYASQEIG